MAKITIGGTEYEVPELNFVALERAWPYVEQAQISQDPMQAVSAGLHIIASGLCEAEHFDKANYGITDEGLLPNLDRDDQIFHGVVYFLRKRLKASEIGPAQLGIMEILREAGLDADPGELLQMASMQNRSTETSQTSSPSSSPQDAKEEAGTA